MYGSGTGPQLHHAPSRASSVVYTFMSTTNEALADEVEAVNSIYDITTLQVTGTDTATGTTGTILSLPGLPFSFLVSFPQDYPDAPPDIRGTESTGSGTKKGAGDSALNTLRDALGTVYSPGQVCLFDLIEETIPLLHHHHVEDHGQQQADGASEDSTESHANRSASPPALASSLQNINIQDLTLTSSSNTVVSSMPPPQWILSEPLVVSKSTFVARALQVQSLSEATDSISHLLATNKRVAAATHNITAWRIKQTQEPGGSTGQQNTAPEIVIQDCDDDGETAAGSRLLHLMQLTDVWNVVVVVTRWYGGVKLGPDRFRCINAVAREALVNGDFVGGEESKTKVKKGKKK